MEIFNESKLREYGAIPKRISRTAVKNSTNNFLTYYKENNVYKHPLFDRIFRYDKCCIMEERINIVLDMFVESINCNKEMESILDFTCIDDVRRMLDTHIFTISYFLTDKYKKEFGRLHKELLLFRDFLLTQMIYSYKIIRV